MFLPILPTCHHLSQMPTESGMFHLIRRGRILPHLCSTLPHPTAPMNPHPNLLIELAVFTLLRHHDSRIRNTQTMIRNTQ